MTFDENVKRLVQYGIESGLVPEEERIYTTNQLLELFGEEEYTEPETEFKDVDLEEVLEELLDYAVEKGVLKENSVVYRDLFDTKIMNCLVPRPAQVIGTFKELYKESPVKATDRSESDRSSKTGKTERLSKMSALPSERRLCRTCQPSGKTEPQDHPDHSERNTVGIPVFTVCIL